ncbi:MAG: hypothetical protein ICV56_05225 [Nitrososphaeraceae archaeon]|nr:hypothetical protein [Nitrososphaeraceae archaeon]
MPVSRMKLCCIINKTMRREAAKSILLSLGFIVILSIIYHDNKLPVFAQNFADNNHNFNFLANTTFINNNKTTTDSANITTLISNDFNIEGTINSQVSAKQKEVGTSKNNLTTSATNIPSQTYLLDGRWRLDVSGGNVTYFKSNITMITITGMEIHDHLIVFKPSTSEMGLLTNNTLSAQNISITIEANNNSISQNASNSIIFSGAADIISNGVMQWRDVPISVSILNDKVISIALDSNRIDDHFFGSPIYGLVGSIEPLVSS